MLIKYAYSAEGDRDGDFIFCCSTQSFVVPTLKALEKEINSEKRVWMIYNRPFNLNDIPKFKKYKIEEI